MNYTDFQDLCDRAETAHCIVKLSRAGDMWGLELVAVSPTPAGFNAAGVLFESIDSLDEHALRLARWLPPPSSPDRPHSAREKKFGRRGSF